MGGPRHGPDFQNLHRNKRSLTLNLKEPDGLALRLRGERHAYETRTSGVAAGFACSAAAPEAISRMGFAESDLGARHVPQGANKAGMARGSQFTK